MKMHILWSAAALGKAWVAWPCLGGGKPVGVFCRLTKPR